MFRDAVPLSVRFLACTIMLLLHIGARGAPPKGPLTIGAGFLLEENIAAHAYSPDGRTLRRSRLVHQG